jgi:plasmid maintenance system antidote protein VapI
MTHKEPHPCTCYSCNFAEFTGSRSYPVKCLISKPVPMMVCKECIGWFAYVGCASHSSTTRPAEQAPVPGYLITDDERKAMLRSWSIIQTHISYENDTFYNLLDQSVQDAYNLMETIRSRPVHQQQEQAVKDKVLDECFQPSPPGDTIKDIMEEKDISRSKLGKLLDIRDEQVSKLLSGIYLIDSDMAYRLSVALGSTQDFWEERERQYRIQLREELRQSAKEPVQEGRAPGDER